MPDTVDLCDLLHEEKAKIYERRGLLCLTNPEKTRFASERERLDVLRKKEVEFVEIRWKLLEELKVGKLKAIMATQRQIAEIEKDEAYLNKRRPLFESAEQEAVDRNRLAELKEQRRKRLVELKNELNQIQEEETETEFGLKLAHRLNVPKLELTGLSLSGGGIRSACFNLGLLEGLDRLDYPRPQDPQAAKPAEETVCLNHLELFDYVSSVSGGSYAAGHLATAMLPPSAADPNKKRSPEWLGKVHLTSKTVPGWLWGVGVWFMGVAFQLLKTGSLLVGFLALTAFVFRTLDGPDATRFWDVLGLNTDISRGFVPFWCALGVFLVACWINDSKNSQPWTKIWLGYSSLVIGLYVVLIWWYHSDPPAVMVPVPFVYHYVLLMALPLPVVVVVMTQGINTAWRRVFRRTSTRARVDLEDRNESRGESFQLLIREKRLLPILVALFCVAGLVTTGDIGLAQPTHSSTQLMATQELSRGLAEKQSWIYNAAWSALGITSLIFFFPRNLFESARRVEDYAAGENNSHAKLRGWGWGPVLRVIIFLSSYGFILLLVFVLYGTVAKENVSGYYEWREDLPYATFHRSEFLDPDQAWEQIARDAPRRATDIDLLPVGWGRLAARMMDLRRDFDLSIDEERIRAGEIRALDSMPWAVRLFPLLKYLGPRKPWISDKFQIEQGFSQLYDAKTRQEMNQNKLALRIANEVLNRPDLYKDLPRFETNAPASKTSERLSPAEYHTLWEKYHKRAEALANLPQDQPAIQSAIRNNNRRALQLYLPDLMRDRVHDPVIFASIVWAEDQWTRLRIVLIAGMLWLLCCAADVNSFSLQKFYRGHVIDSWVKIPRDNGYPRGESFPRWLYETGPTYRGKEYQGCEADHHAKPKRRAPLLLINATFGGNRSLGDEPDMKASIFTFSPIASGSGFTGHWLNEDKKNPLARRSYLDIGNIVATSGAFLTPGNVANPALSAILHLLNIQTGYWVHDPKKYETRTPKESFLFHGSQSLGIDREGDSRFMLSDGAHVENLGLYVLLQRRCSLIVASDCSQEDRTEKADRRFDALIHVLQQAHVDGIEVGPFLNSPAFRHWLGTGTIPKDGNGRDDCRRPRSAGLDLVRPTETVPTPPRPKDPWLSWWSPAPAEPVPPNSSPAAGVNGQHYSPAGQDATKAGAGFAQEHYLFAQIIYPDSPPGLLVYLRPTLTGDEGDDLLHRSADSRFPDDDPADQFYTPSKMSTYRLLGRHIAQDLMNDPLMMEVLGKIVRGKSIEILSKAQRTAFEAECASSCEADSPCGWNRHQAFRSTRMGARKPSL